MLYHCAGNQIVSAATTWLLLDTKRRRMARIPQFILDFDMPDIEFLQRPSNKIKTSTRADISDAYTVKWHEIDWNEHLNNIHYTIKMLDAIPRKILENCRLKCLNLTYKTECKLGEKILVQTDTQTEGEYLHCLKNIDTEKDAAYAISTWV